MNRLRYLGVALVAGTVGAMVALMIAPDSGENTRRRMRKRLERERALMAKRSRRLAASASDYVGEQLETGKRAVLDMTDEAYGKLQKGKRKVARIVGV
jgi:gas vesicle protein